MPDTPAVRAAEFIYALLDDSIENAIAVQDLERVAAIFKIRAAVAKSPLTADQMQLLQTLANEAITALETDPANNAGVTLLQQVTRVAAERLDAYEKATTDAASS